MTDVWGEWATEATNQLDPELVESPAHPYPRYGLATAYLLERVKPGDVAKADLPELLACAIEHGIEHFRMETQDVPGVSTSLRYRPITMAALQNDPKLVQGGLSAEGKYLYPSVITTDGDARGTFDNAVEIAGRLRRQARLESSVELKRSFAPTVSKINNGNVSQCTPRGTLFDAACALIATLTPIKPAAWVEGRNTAIFPDLPLTELREFVAVFRTMQLTETGDLMEARLPKKDLAARPVLRTTKGAPRKAAKIAIAKSEFKRPPLHRGNYPGAPRDAAAFGAAGLLGAIGRWAVRVEDDQREGALRVLDSLANRPMYVVSYDGVSQAQFSHHVISLAKRGRLADLIDAFNGEARLYAYIEDDRPRWDVPAYKLFYLMTGRFLQQFDRPAFRDFLASRAEYPPITDLLLGEYFMNVQKTPKETVQSARALGQWLNRTAYLVAESEIQPVDPADRGAYKDRLLKDKGERGKFYKAVRKAKAKILVEFEGAVMSAKSPADMLRRVSTRAGRLLQDDAPSTATAFFDATAGEEITFETAQYLLIAYMRLRAPMLKTEAPDPYAIADGADDTSGDIDDIPIPAEQGETA